MSFQGYLTNIEAKTGKSADELKALAIGRGLATSDGIAPSVKAGDIVAWLKNEFALGHGHAMAICWLYQGHASVEAFIFPRRVSVMGATPGGIVAF